MTLVTGAIMLLAIPVIATQVQAALPLTPVPTFNTSNDENGANDQPGQKDLTKQGVGTNGPGDLWTMWQWDDTSLSGGNTGDACSLFDTDNDSRVNFAVCVTIQSNPAVQAPISPRVYTCGDGKVDRCTSTYTQISPINTACATNRLVDSPFPGGGKDTQAICHIDLMDVGGAISAKLVNTCSYPSEQPTSAPSDCVLIPRDAFVVIQKMASPNEGSFPFRLGTGAAATNPVVFTANGSQTSDPIAIRSGVNHNLKEDVPANWAIDTPGPVCSGASGAGTSNGAPSGDTISGIKAASDNVITCVYRDKKLTGAITITKQRSNSTTTLAGAHFSIDGAGDHITGSDGTVCVAGLTLGSHTVTETQAPNGHDLASPASQSVSVTASATCSTGTPATVTFNDPLVPGTINIAKTKSTGGPLAGATFTLYVNNAPLAAPRGNEDTEIPTKTCMTDAAGLCNISGVAPGDYWVVETGVPAGYQKAADQSVNVGIGTTPGNGDTDNLSFENTPAPGRVDIVKTGFGGAPLEGAEFTLFTRTGPETEPLPGAILPTKKCTTDENGLCSITGVAPGLYWVVETVTPPGYDTANPEAIVVPIGSDPNAGAIVELPISNPVVPGEIVIHKLGIDESDLNGAQFTLYENNAPLTGTRGNEDTITTKTCTTAGAGTCTISGVTPGDYWVVETVTPAGYDTAPEQKVNVGIGTTAHAGDSDGLEFVDPVVPGKVSITKTDDANNVLQGAEFTLYVNNAPLGAPLGNEDTITTKTCVTAANGKCDITGVAPGKYWVVETDTPEHYDTAADQAITVGLGSAAHQGDTVPVSFVNERQHRVVVVVCHEGTDTLFSRDVTVGGVTKQSVDGTGMTDAEEKELCDTGGASFGDISGHPDKNALIELSKVDGGS